MVLEYFQWREWGKATLAGVGPEESWFPWMGLKGDEGEGGRLHQVWACCSSAAAHHLQDSGCEEDPTLFPSASMVTDTKASLRGGGTSSAARQSLTGNRERGVTHREHSLLGSI